MRYVCPWRNPVKFDVESTHHSEGLWVEAAVTQVNIKGSTGTNIVEGVL